jgi:gliding motility-associated-like protein
MNSSGCDSLATLQLTVQQTPPSPQVVANQNYCVNQPSLPLSANATFPLNWYTSATGGVSSSTPPTPSTSTAGVFNFYVSQSNGSCESPRVRIAVRVNPKPSLGSDKQLRLCAGAVANLTTQYNTGSLTTQWSFQGSPVYNPTQINQSGLYQLIATNSNGCSDTAMVNVSIQPPVIANAGPDDNAVFNQPYILTGSGGTYYSWSPANLVSNPSSPNPTTTLTSDQSFVLTVRDDIGCTDRDTVFLRVLNGPTFYIPNAFTPNGDGLNDVFRPTYVGIQKLDYFRIFNRFGEKVFETAEIGKGWDGTYKGIKQPLGNYVYVVRGVDMHGKEKVYEGNMLLIR